VKLPAEEPVIKVKPPAPEVKPEKAIPPLMRGKNQRRKKSRRMKRNQRRKIMPRKEK